MKETVTYLGICCVVLPLTLFIVLIFGGLGLFLTIDMTTGMYPTDELETVSLDSGYQFKKLHPDLPTEWAYVKEYPATVVCDQSRYSLIHLLDKYKILYTCGYTEGDTTKYLTFQYEVLNGQLTVVDSDEVWEQPKEIKDDEQAIFDSQFKADNDKITRKFDNLRSRHPNWYIKTRDFIFS